MNAPLIFIAFPGILAGFLYMFRRKKRLVNWLGSCAALSLAFLAWRMPIGSEIRAGPYSWIPQLFVNESLTMLGRQFILADPARTTLLIIYLGAAIWFIGSSVADTTRLFIPLGLGIAALLTATISVEPFLYSALFIEIAVLLCIPILTPPGQPVSRGALRFMTFQTIGILVLLFLGSVLGSTDPSQIDGVLLTRITILLGLGFALVIGVFPFSIWIQMTAQDAHPYSAAFIFFTVPQILILFTLNFFSQSPWIQTSPMILEVLSILGGAMIFGAGIWSIFQNHLGKIFGFAVISEIGLSLISISQIVTENPQSAALPIPVLARVSTLNMFLIQFLPYGLNLAIWALALAIVLKHTKRLDFEAVAGSARQLPLAALSIGLAQLSIAGFPLLAGYMARTILGAELAADQPFIAYAALIGFGSLMISAIRSQVVLFSGEIEKSWQINENRLQASLLIGGCALLLFLGILYPLILPGFSTLIPGSTSLAP